MGISPQCRNLVDLPNQCQPKLTKLSLALASWVKLGEVL